ncbi:hypothetical protein JW859_01985 [bacterium]|nr:hypothetical protein [bacterium]
MRLISKLGLVLVAVIAASLSACGGGGGVDPVTITAINLNPSTVAAGSIVTLSASISAPGQSVSSLVKNWTVSAGSLTADQPDFSLLLRETARGASAASVSTTANSVYWVAPATAGSVTITVQVDETIKTQNITVGASPVTLSVTSGAGGGKTCTITAHDVTDLYQVAFRLSFTSAWSPDSVAIGGFLGDAGDILELSMTNQNGFVPVAITRKGNVAGVNGTGELASIEFSPSGSSSSVSQADVPFVLEIMDMRDSNDDPISFD